MSLQIEHALAARASIPAEVPIDWQRICCRPFCVIFLTTTLSVARMLDPRQSYDLIDSLDATDLRRDSQPGPWLAIYERSS